MSIRLVTYDSNTDKFPKLLEFTKEDLVSVLLEHERTACTPCPGKSCPHKFGAAFSPGIITEGTRLDKNVSAVSLIAFDIDHANQAYLEALAGRLEGFEAVLYSTHTHRPPDDMALRLVLFPSREILPREWPGLWQQLVNDFGITTVDDKAKNLSRVFFFPTAPEGAEVLAVHEPGRLVDVDEVVARAKVNSLRHLGTPGSRVNSAPPPDS